MNEDQWEVVYETSGPFQAEMLRGILEANQIPVFLSQEGAGKAYGLTFGRLGQVQVLVPHSKFEIAQKLVQEVESGTLLEEDFPEEESGGDDLEA
jgi:hypothetical protein